MTRKCRPQSWLQIKFPQFPAPFPGAGKESADFGQNLEKLSIKQKKFAAKFPAAGNWHLSTGPHASFVF